MNWQPMSTAPRDGVVDLWHRSGFRMTDVWWDADDECWSCAMNDSEFTHWMPAPQAPHTEAERVTE
jgi:hypothetical protein